MLKFTRFLSSTVKSYDLISIGPYANQVTKMISQSSQSKQLKKLSIQYTDHIIQPTLHFCGHEKIPLFWRLNKFSDVELGVMVQRILPEENKIIMRNKTAYKYRYLVYSGSETEWMDTNFLPKYTQEDLENIKFTDFDFQNVNDLYQRNFGTIVFLIPNSLHFGYENYFMLYLKAFIEKKQHYKHLPLSIKILNLGNSLIPFSSAQNQVLQHMLKVNNIEVFNNCDLKYIDRKSKKIHVNNSCIKYDGFLYYIPTKVPEILSKAKINPFYVNQKRLNNSAFQNVYVIGNILPNVYSFDVKKEMISTIAKNIIYKSNKVPKQTYCHLTNQYKFWVSNKNIYTEKAENTWKKEFKGRIRGMEDKFVKYQRIKNFFHSSFLANLNMSLLTNTETYNPSFCPMVYQKQ